MWAVVLAFASVGAGTGCWKNGGVERFALWGRITLDGRPVPAGVIILRPDTAAGAAGPGAEAVIRGGEYRTRPGFGPVVGRHVLAFVLGDGVNPTEVSPFGALLTKQPLPPMTLDVPKGGGIVDIDLPTK